ncbi:MAG: LysM peptidoglycan-binding domain-containing protein [Bdellovibrionaceae bacterium]|nr:LysM peptidoglycan-binding domain-containing protein [Pseudobdellovibrionaceae bacterium]
MILFRSQDFVKFSASLMTVVLLGACAHQTGGRVSSPTEGSPASFAESDDAHRPNPPTAGASLNPRVPIAEHELVDLWIRYFQTRGREHMERYLARSTRYGELMRAILRDNGLPEDLIYVALIESGFSSRAVSHASAVGYWQFIKGTGRRYQLQITPLVDERRDPVLSTQAASLYFRDLYSMFDDWYLALASYNAGENKLLRLVQKYNTKDFWELIKKKRALPKETIHYVPKFIAAKLIAENPAQYGFTDIEYEEPLRFERIVVDYPVDLKRLALELDLDYDELKVLNPRYRGAVAPNYLNGQAELRVPLEKKTVALQALERCRVDPQYLAYYKNDDIMTHRVRRGESLASIAKKYKTSVAILRELNDLKPNRRLRVGQRLDVPRRSVAAVRGESVASLKERASSQNLPPVAAVSSKPEDVTQNSLSPEDSQTPSMERPTMHVVQKGETLLGIAEQYDVSVHELLKLNKLKRRSVIRVGMRLKLPTNSDTPLPATVVEKEGLRRGGGGTGGGMARGLSSERSSSATTKRRVPSRAPTVAQIKGVKSLKTRYHVVKKGETLSDIARRYGVSAQKLLAWNKLSRPHHVEAGRRLKLFVMEP